ncbi:complement factor H-like [Halichoeres trimaculatus]|uniref:complement factor H-like n=1 Tax=Halichoeres trimaculatus TaxID=147232 RepID=UPI003D9DC583
MHVITRSCVLFLWIQTLVFVKSQDCTLQDFISSPLFDSNFNTTSLQAIYSEGRKVRVDCNVGYSGFFKLICEGGEWYVTGTKCQAHQCPVVLVDDNVLVVGDPVASTTGNVLLFSCKSSMEYLNGEQEIYCAANGEWSAPPPTCGEIKCPAPDIANGHIIGDVRDYKEGEVLHFTCNRQYKKQSGIPSKCLKLGTRAEFSPAPVCEVPSGVVVLGFDGKMHTITRTCVLFLWIQTLVLVKSQDCTLQDFISGPLFDSNFDTTNLEASYSGGRQVRVSCNVGYSGFFKLICVEGKWQSRGTKCQAKSCGHPGDAQFADFQLNKGQDFVFGSEVLYTCHKGYQMVSRSSVRRCMAEGWDGVVPVCEAQQCPVINVEDNVVVIGDPQDSNYGNVLRFNCKLNGEVLDGAQEIYCDENGQWSADPPTCKEIKCPAPDIANGRITGDVRDYKEGEVLHFTCNPKYKKQSGIPAKCLKLGTIAEFSPAPICEESTCTLPPSSNQGSNYDPPRKNVFRPDETVTVTCDRTYYVETPKTTSKVCTCDENGNWDITPECQEVRCRDERPLHVSSFGPPRSYWGEQRIFRMDDTAEFQCAWGYRATAHRATCTRDGWVPDPLCKGIPCDKKEVPNAEITLNDKESYVFGEWVRYVCKEGYTGQFTLTCRGNDWHGNPVCTEAGCAEIDISGARILHARRSYRHGDYQYYTCENDPQQRRIDVICDKGNWNGIQTCEGCPKLKIQNGFVVAQSDEKVYYTCNEDYKLTTKGWWNEAKCENRKWTGHQKCIEKSHCGPLPVILNGKLIRRGTISRSTAQITCEEGYRAPAQRLTCQNGTWDFGEFSPETLCTPISSPCNPPPRVMYAVIRSSYQEKYLSGTELTYQCAEGYTMEGDNRIRCLNGQWEQGRNMTCTPHQCPVVHVDDNVLVVGDPVASTPGNVLLFSCKSSTEYLNGEQEINCAVDGKWSALPPTCGAPQGCGRPPFLENGDTTTSVRQQYNHGDRVDYACQRLHKLEGQSFKICNNGKWAGEIRCLRPCTINSMHLEEHNIQFAFSSAGKLYSEHGTGQWFECKEGKHLIGTRVYQRTLPHLLSGLLLLLLPFMKMRFSLILLSLQLLGDVKKSWSQNVCSNPAEVPHATITEETRKDVYTQGHVIHYTCDIGYISGPTIRSICTNEGWHRLHDGKCVLKPCPLPEDTPNGYFEIISGNEFVFGATIKYYCNSGFQMVSKEDTRGCMLEGWTNHVPVCQPFSCNLPPEDERMTVNNLPSNDDPILPHRFLTFSCDQPGTYLNGSSMLTCDTKGEWDHPFPTCEEITCQVESMHSHLNITGLPSGNKTVKVGQKLHFQCDGQYSLEGPEGIECLANGEWNAPFPTCTDKCRVTGLTDSVRASPRLQNNQQVRKGIRIRFECANYRRGHELRGSQYVECLANGQWSEDFPTCGPPLGCGRPPFLENGDTTTSVRQQYNHGDRVDYACQRLHKVEGQSFKICKNGKWTGEMRCLRPCTVNSMHMEENNIQFAYSSAGKLYSEHGTGLWFECKEGKHLTGTVGFRQYCHDGVIQLPTCV